MGGEGIEFRFSFVLGDAVFGVGEVGYRFVEGGGYRVKVYAGGSRGVGC